MVLGGREGGRTKVRVTEAEAPAPGSKEWADPSAWVTRVLPGDGSVAALIYVVDVGAFSATPVNQAADPGGRAAGFLVCASSC